MSRLDDLCQSLLFQDVLPEAVQDAASAVVERQFRSGELLLQQDVPGDALLLLTRGSVRVIRMSVSGRERVMGDIYAPGVVGETAVLEGGERSATVRALEDVTVLMLYRDHFEQILRRHPRVLWNLSRLLARRVTLLNDELIALGQNTETALAHVLSSLYTQRVGAGLAQPQILPLGTQDIMNRISASRETVARVMRRLEQQGLVRTVGGTIHLLDPQRLGRLALESGDFE
jgi:CRP-like cAMP-binding protein